MKSKRQSYEDFPNVSERQSQLGSVSFPANQRWTALCINQSRCTCTWSCVFICVLIIEKHVRIISVFICFMSSVTMSESLKCHISAFIKFLEWSFFCELFIRQIALYVMCNHEWIIQMSYGTESVCTKFLEWFFFGTTQMSQGSESVCIKFLEFWFNSYLCHTAESLIL